MGLRRQVVYLLRPDFPKEVGEIVRVGDVSFVQFYAPHNLAGRALSKKEKGAPASVYIRLTLRSHS
jgi:hypothetical protein